jgi:sulfur carrier protein
VIEVELNGRPAKVAEGTTIEQLIAAQTGSLRGSAVVVDGEVVPRSAWAERVVTEGQVVELITAVQGG